MNKTTFCQCTNPLAEMINSRVTPPLLSAETAVHLLKTEANSRTLLRIFLLAIKYRYRYSAATFASLRVV
jgi:hypothetical protein